MASGNPSNAAYPAALDALDPKVTADNGGDFEGLLQPKHQPAAIANATDAASAITQLNLALAALRTVGIIKS